MTLADQTVFKQLSPAEELAAWEAGDHDALVQSVWPFVLRTATRFARRDDSIFDDLLSIGHLHVARALQTFDPRRSRWISYSCRFLAREMRRACRNHAVVYRAALSEKTSAKLGGGQGIDQATIEGRELLTIARRTCSQTEFQILVDVCHGRTFDEISRQFGCTRQNVQLKHRRAIEKCRSVLGLRDCERRDCLV